MTNQHEGWMILPYANSKP